MTANPRRHRPVPLLRADDEPGVYRFRVFYLQVNGRRSVVGAWQLYETMRDLKLATRYSTLANLDEHESLEFCATIHGAPLVVSVAVGTWQVTVGAEPAGKAA